MFQFQATAFPGFPPLPAGQRPLGQAAPLPWANKQRLRGAWLMAGCPIPPAHQVQSSGMRQYSRFARLDTQAQYATYRIVKQSRCTQSMAFITTIQANTKTITLSR